MTIDIILIEPDLPAALRARFALASLPGRARVHHLNGVEPLPALLESVTPAAVIIDRVEPGRWGVLDIARVRMTVPPGVPIVVMTAETDPMALVTADAAGISARLGKSDADYAVLSTVVGGFVMPASTDGFAA